MKIFTALLGLLTAVTVITAITDNQDAEKRQLGVLLKDLGQAIESAVDCAGCQVRNLHVTNPIRYLVFLLSLRSLETLKLDG